MLEKSDSIKNLAMALRKTQEEVGKVNFDSVNPFLHNQYASLGAIIEASKPILVKNGLSISQPTTTNEYGIGIITILMHDSGEWISSTATIPLPDYLEESVGNEKPKRNNLAQESGSIITYLRRYSLAAILNLYADEDTDGNGNEAKKRIQENQKEEGYVSPVGLPKQTATMSLEMAKSIVSSEGVKYGDIDNNKLQNMANALQAAIKKNAEPEKKEDRQFKIDAIRCILMNRAEENPA